jgi:ferredoxin
VFSLLGIGVVFRLTFFLIATFKKDQHGENPPKRTNSWVSVGKLFIPLHKAILKKPFYTILRYVFHICMIVTPIWLAGHVSLLEVSSLELSWITLPDNVADIMTIIFIGLGVLFLLRRVIFNNIRERSSAFDYIFLVICLLPFVSGYFMAHGTLDSIDFFSENIFSIHILTSCLMTIMVVFLFVGTRLDIRSCIGCASCEINCPTGTLESAIQGVQKVFNYSQYQCISCGSCIYACPEDAVELRHELGLKRFFQVLQKRMIRAVELKECRRCGARFAPEPQIAKLGHIISKDYYQFCPDCKITNLVSFDSEQVSA